MRYVVEAPDTLPLQADPAKVNRILINLLGNAFKFTPHGGTIRLSAQDAGAGRVFVEVADSGAGVPSEQREAIFERFVQIDGGSTRRFGGTGLGLAISREFAELHGGELTVSEAPEGGALFRLVLPSKAPEGVEVTVERPDEARERAGRQVAEELRLRTEAVAAAVGAPRPRVLVVEDNPEMNRFVQDSLAPQFLTSGALDGREGLAKALEDPPDLVLSDIMMPEMSGDELVREIRRHAELATVPIILLTAKADDALRVELLQSGAQDYLMKPFSADELRARVSNLVTMKRARDVLQEEIETQTSDLERLAAEVTHRKRELQTALA